jgi:hypothetical protein
VEKVEIRKRLRQVYQGGPEVERIAARARPFVLEHFDVPVISRITQQAIFETCMKIPPPN